MNNYQTTRSKMTLNNQVILEGYPFPNGVVGGSTGFFILVVKSSLCLIEKTTLNR